MTHSTGSILRKLPPFAFEEDILYCRPKQKTPANNDQPWYECSAGGRNKLSSVVKEMCQEAGLAVKTNHSLRATGASTMFQAEAPEKIIQKTTGHRSLEALRMYEKVPCEQQQAVSSILMSSKPSTYNSKVQATSSTSCSDVKISRPLFGDISNCSIGAININIQGDNTKRDLELLDSCNINLDLQY